MFMKFTYLLLLIIPIAGCTAATDARNLLNDLGKPYVVQPATATQPAVIITPTPQVVAATQKAGALLDKAAPVISDIGAIANASPENIEAAIGNAIVKYTPPPYQGYAALGLLGYLFLRKAIPDVLTIKKKRKAKTDA
jgi:hypothetical protein